VARHRATARISVALFILAFCLAGYALSWPLRRRIGWPRFFLQWFGEALGLEVRVEGRPAGRDVLYVANHVSWLDILALGGATRAVFVSRDDVEDWPGVGWIAGLNDTIYVARQAKREVHGQADQLRRALAAGRAVALFPEGTTDHAVMPFRPSLFASLFPPLDDVRVQPVAIDYGELDREIAWVGDEPAGANAMRVVGRRGTIPVTLRFLEPIDPHAAGDRKILAKLAEAEVIEALGFSGAPEPLYAPQ
jgi:1-acyl-sn-glycerol-3-phosphate acyltransferase